MDEDRKHLQESRRIINLLTRTCRQVNAFFDGISVLDQNRVKKMLREAIRESERFLNS